MKQFQNLFIILFILLLGCVQSAWAVEYVLNTNPDANINGSSKEFTLSCPGETLTFDLNRQGWATGSVSVVEYDTNGNSNTILDGAEAGNSSISAAVKSYSATVSKSTVKIKISASGTLKKTLQNVLVTKRFEVSVVPNPIECGAIDVLTSSTDTKFSVDWCNVKPLTLSLNNTTDFALGTTTVASSSCGFGTASGITIDFHPQTKGDKTATLTLSNADGTQATVTIKGHADSIPQQLIWWDDYAIMQLTTDSVIESCVRTSSGLPLTELTSSDPSVARIENGNLIAVAPGYATITAYQAGTATYGLVREERNIQITDKQIQRISWDQNLSFKFGASPETLTATSSAGLPITYEIVENTNNVISLSDGVISISTTNAGIATVRALQVGNETYESTYFTRIIRVRDPNVTCLSTPWNLDDATKRNFSTISSYTYNLDGSPADKLSFTAWCEDLLLFWGGDLYVAQYVNGSWQNKIYTCKFSKKDTEYAFNNIQLNRNATKVKLYTETGATGYKYFKNVKVTRAHYCETDVNSLNFEGQYNTLTKKTFKLNYSNAQDDIELSIKSGNSEFAVSPAVINVDCGDYATKTITVSYTPNAIESDEEILVIKSEKDGWNLEIPISTTVSKRSQYIPWEMRDSVATVQPFTLAKINSVSGLPITYEIDDESILTLDEDNRLVFLQVDTAVTIRATCPGNANYNDAEPVEHRIKIFKGLATLTLPTPEKELVYGQTLGELNLIGGTAVDQFGNVIEGDFAWKSRETVPNAGVNVYYPIHFVPYNQSLYDNVNDSVRITVNKHTQLIEWYMPDSIGVMDSLILDAYSSPSGLDVTYQLSGEGAAYASVGADNALNIAANVAALGKELTITAWQVGNHNYFQSDTVSYTVVLRKTRPEFVAITEPTSAGTHLNDVPVYVEHSVAGSWEYENTSNPELPACIYTIKATFTPARLDLCDPVTVEIPINVNE